jgi:hypothetical protein
VNEETKTTNAPVAPHMDQLREHLMATLASLRNRDNPMEPDRARAVAQVAGVLVDTAKVEVEFLKATGQDRSRFLGGPEAPALENKGGSGYTQGEVSRWPGVTVHKLKG